MKIEYDASLYRKMARFSINDIVQVSNRRGRKSTIQITNVTSLTWHQLQLLVPDGCDRFTKMVLHGALSPEITPFPLKVALRKSLTMRGFLFLEVLHDPVLREQARRFILSSIGAGYLRPVIDRCFNFEDMHDAQRYLESNQQIGKIVVTLNT